MSDPHRPGDVPPDLPPDYADAYRRGYERAFGGSTEPDEHTEPTSVLPPMSRAVSDLPPRVGEHRADEGRLDDIFHDEYDEPDRDPRRPGWFVPALLGGLVVALLVVAFVLGKWLSGSMSGADTSASKPSGNIIPSNGGGSGQTHKSTGKKYAGRTVAAPIGGATASCQAADGVDSAGNKVSYAPSNLYDGDPSTAWRCDGDAAGQKLTISLAGQTEIGSVGLIPGYAKTDPTSGANRYAENDRITRVRWTFSDGTRLEQTFNGSPTDRRMQSIHIPKTNANQVTIEILSSTPGPRHTVAVSEVRLGKVAG